MYHVSILSLYGPSYHTVATFYGRADREAYLAKFPCPQGYEYVLSHGHNLECVHSAMDAIHRLRRKKREA